MKTMKSRSSMKTLAFTAIALFLFFTSCKDTETVDYTADDNTNLQTEASTEAEIEDASDIASVAMTADPGTSNGGRTGETTGIIRNITDRITDGRLSCATVTLEFADDNVPADQGVIAIPHGYITIDFGNGCTAPNGKVRKGKIIIEFKGRRFLPASFVKITFEDYFINGIQVEGMRVDTNITESTESSPSFRSESEVKITFPDATFATRTSTKTRVWNRAVNPLEDSWTVTGSAFGKTRNDKEYAMTITKALVFKRACAISSRVVLPVEGIKELVANTKKITMDFGNGDCDNNVTITINGRSREVDVSGDGN